MSTPSSSPNLTTTRRQKLLLLAFGLALGLAVLALAEVLLAFLGLGEDERFADPYVGFESATPLFTATERDGRTVYVTHPAKERFFNYQELPAEKADDTYRVFTLGGSTTAGRPYDDHVSFARWLERYLDAAEPGRRHEVVNAGAISYASYRVVRLMKELAHYEPDLFVVLTGHNEFLEERSYRELHGQNAALRWIGSRLARFRLPQLVRKAFAKEDAPAEQLADDFKTRLEVWTGLEAYERDDELHGRILEHFAFNLEQMVAIADVYGVDLVFVCPVSNLKDFSPFKSQHRDGLTREEEDRFEEFLAAGRKLLEEGSAKAALKPLGQALAIDSEHAGLHFRIGRAELARGSYVAARDAFLRAKELDVAPLRAHERTVELIAETAARHGVPLVDLPAILEAENVRRLGHDILGREFLLDHVHPTIEVHSRIAEEILATLAGTGAVRLDPGWTSERRAAIYDGVVGSLDRTYYAERDRNLGKVLGWAGKLEEAAGPLQRAAEVLEGETDVHLNLGILWQKTGRYEDAVRELQRAVAADSGSAEAHFNLGVVYGRLRRLDEGVAALRAAVRLRPGYAEARYNLGVLLHQTGDAEAAVASLEEARRFQPGAPELHRSLGLAYRLAGRDAEAEASFRDSLRLADSAAVRTDLAVTLATSGRLDEAAAELRRAVEVDPGYAETHYNLGLLHAQAGRPAEAAVAYERTLDLEEGHALAHNNLGILRAGEGEMEAARRHLERATQINPGYAEAFLNLGVVYDASGRRQDAVEAVERALALRGKDGRIHLALAMLYQAQGRDGDALVHFEAARRAGETIPPEAAARLRE